MKRTVFITGATDGLGKAVAQKLARQGAELILHGRSESRCRAVMQELTQHYGAKSVRYYVADFLRLQAIFDMIADIKQHESGLDVLVNNAGIGVEDVRSCSEDGFEKALQVNYLSTYALTLALHRLVDRRNGRVICVSSSSQATVDFDDPCYRNAWNGAEAYGRSKWAQAAFAIGRAQQQGTHGPAICAVHPGAFMPTKLVLHRFPVNDSLETGVDSLCNLIDAEHAAEIHGRYFEKTTEVPALDSSYNETVQRRLFDMSENMLANARLRSDDPVCWRDVC